MWSCSLAIGELLVTNAIPIAKLTKIKKYVKALGGAWETAKLLVGAIKNSSSFSPDGRTNRLYKRKE